MMVGRAIPSSAASPIRWRCPSCDRICNRLRLSRLAPGDWIEHRCKCGAWSTVEEDGGRIVIRHGKRGED